MFQIFNKEGLSMAPSTVRCQKVKGTCEVSKVFDQQNFMIAAVTVMRTAFCASAFAEKILHCRQQGTGMHKNRQTNLMQAQGPGTRHVYPATLDIINKTETDPQTKATTKSNQKPKTKSTT